LQVNESSLVFSIGKVSASPRLSISDSIFLMGEILKILEHLRSQETGLCIICRGYSSILPRRIQFYIRTTLSGMLP
jgi:hypothetical protein